MASVRLPARLGRRPWVSTALLVFLGPAELAAQELETVVQGSSIGDPEDQLPAGRATGTVTQADLERRLPRSTPDALRYVPGVSVQQTAHGQASAYIRGLTGQQTLLLFDGIRINTSTWRQGPNQYAFTLDSQSLAALEVLRGGASTRYGSDAIGGVISAQPLEPRIGQSGFELHPLARGRFATADDERGGRLQLEAIAGPNFGIIGGGGFRRVGLLESSGPVLNPADGQVPPVPRFLPDGRTQRGTGFDEWTADVRAVLRPAPDQSFTIASYLYRELNAPRTDQCPPPSARDDECLVYLEQFRTLTYAAWELRPEDGPVRWARVTASWQNQHELRSGNRPASYVVNTGEDDVDTLGLTAATRFQWSLDESTLALTTGIDGYLDLVHSASAIRFTDIDVTVPRSRGQYLGGSRYFTGGVFADLALRPAPEWVLRGGARLGWVEAHAPGDPDSGSRPVDARWHPTAGHLGAEWQPHPAWTLLADVDLSFRAPNLDDLTSRQQTGPGFQFENPDLRPERALGAELGTRLRTGPVKAELWVFQTWIDSAIGKVTVPATECPPETPQCLGSWNRVQLVNAPDVSVLRGLEAMIRVRPVSWWWLRATTTWTWGEGPNLADPPIDPTVPYAERVPLSRVPPLNGTMETEWSLPLGLRVGAALRWAAAQTRLAVADQSDARIPLGGTPGYAVVDLRAGWVFGQVGSLALVLENLLDTPYRVHGSSVNGAARGLIASLTLHPF